MVPSGDTQGGHQVCTPPRKHLILLSRLDQPSLSRLPTYTDRTGNREDELVGQHFTLSLPVHDALSRGLLPFGAISRTSASHSAHSMGPTCVQVCFARRPPAWAFRKHLVQKPSPHWSHFLVDLFCSHSTQLDCFRASIRSSSVMPGFGLVRRNSSQCM